MQEKNYTSGTAVLKNGLKMVEQKDAIFAVGEASAEGIISHFDVGTDVAKCCLKDLNNPYGRGLDGSPNGFVAGYLERGQKSLTVVCFHCSGPCEAD